MNLREAFDLHYDKADLSKGRIVAYNGWLKMWSRFTGNPSVETIDNETCAVFRRGALDAGYNPTTVNTAWRGIRAILRRIGPPVTGNPFGMGIIERIPAMKPCKTTWKPPRRLTLEALDRFYLACTQAQFPCRKLGVPAAQWWQALLVLAFTTGLRKSDLLSLTFDQFDFENQELHATAGKTGKFDVFPLHAVAVEHIERIRTARQQVFCGVYRVGSRFHTLLREIQTAAGVEPFGMHDIRRTAASEIERVRPGMGAVFLQHAPRSVTGLCYLNGTDELREAIDKMRLPLTFRHGIKMADRHREQELRERQQAMMRPERFAIATKPDPADWQFHGAAFWLREVRYPMGGSRGRVLRTLVEATGPASIDALAEAIAGGRPTPETFRCMQHQVSQVISDVRKRLRRMMHLPSGWEPIPNVDLNGRGGGWTICLPPASDRVEAGKGGQAGK